MQIPKIKMLVLSVTGKCNFACRYCYASEHSEEYMTEATAVKAVKLAQKSGKNFVIQFSGGEPLLNFKVIQAVTEYVERNKVNAKMQIQTNASLLTDDIAEYLFKHRIAIGISLDGRPAVNDKLRITKAGKGASGEIINGVQVLKRNNIACGITCVVTEENIDTLPDIVEMAYFLGNVRRIGFDLLRGQGRGSGLKAPAPDKMRKAIEDVYRKSELLGKLSGYQIKFSQRERAEVLKRGVEYEFGHCYAMNGEAAFVDAKGDIYACSSLVGNQEFYIGNVNNGIDNTAVEKIKARIKASMQFCRECSDFKLCGGGCFARWYGNGEKQPYLSECEMKKFFAKLAKSDSLY